MEKLNDPSFSLLAHLGFSNEDVSKANDYVCGTMTLEGAPFLEKRTYLFLTAQIHAEKG